MSLGQNLSIFYLQRITKPRGKIRIFCLVVVTRIGFFQTMNEKYYSVGKVLHLKKKRDSIKKDRE
jgi:hypothetical protein